MKTRIALSNLGSAIFNLGLSASLFLLFSQNVTGQCLPAFTVDTSNCPTVAFTDFSTSTSGVIVAWSWNFGDGNIANTPNVSHTYTSNGTFLVCLTITTSNFCSSNFCVPVTISCIAPPPMCDAAFQYTLGQCPQVSFFDGSTSSPGSVTSWSWDFGDGNTSNQQNPSHTYSTNGTYLSCLTITSSDSCSSTYCDTVTINCIQPPGCNAFFQYTLGQCPDILFFDGSTSSPGSVTSWSWDFGDGNTSNLQNPAHTYSANGTYLNCLTIVTDDACSSTYCDTILINCIQPPVCDAAFQYTLGQCPQVSFFDASTASPGQITSWSWDFGDGNTSNQQNPSHTYSANGTYLNCLTIVSSDSCSSTYCDTIPISCIQPPTCNAFFQYTLGQCPDILYFDGSTSSPGAVTSWSWDFGDGNTSNLQNPAHTYSANGTYLNCLTIVTDDACTSTYCDTIPINCIQSPVCDAAFQYTLGQCPQVSFFDASTASPGQITSWSWDFGDGSTSNQQNPTHIYGANGTYLSCLTIVSTDSCTSTYCDTVIVHCNTGGNVGICTDQPTEKLDIQGGIRIRELPEEVNPAPRMVVADEFGVLYWRALSPPPAMIRNAQSADVLTILESQARLIEELKARIEELEKKIEER